MIAARRTVDGREEGLDIGVCNLDEQIRSSSGAMEIDRADTELGRADTELVMPSIVGRKERLSVSRRGR